ncbi:MAG: prepilin-type N-terminal cleavage/methylation domain-containing protein [Acidobacteria bacterium]|nr:prepilin-type N-terminal cleavage/methylation domain-containing protein [Acidobacteriota bacterium]
MPKEARGYSLIELLFVAAILLVITAIAVPRFLRTKYSANEASAANSLKQIASANINYYTRFNQGYAGTLAQLGPPSAGCADASADCADLLDGVVSGVALGLAVPIKSGYSFTYYAPDANPSPTTPNNTYAVVATPVMPGNSGDSTFCVDNRGQVLRDKSGTVATADPSGCAASWPVGGDIGPI